MQNPDLEQVRQELNDLVSTRSLAPLGAVDELRYKDLCQMERLLLEQQRHTHSVTGE